MKKKTPYAPAADAYAEGASERELILWTVYQLALEALTRSAFTLLKVAALHWMPQLWTPDTASTASEGSKLFAKHLRATTSAVLARRAA
jgi:hypothetical protein